MRINNLDNVNKIYKSNLETKEGKSVKKKKEDKIELSNEAIEYRFAMSKVKEKPEIRQNKVNKIKSQIKAGTYEVDSEKIADKMLGTANLRRKFNSW